MKTTGVIVLSGVLLAAGLGVGMLISRGGGGATTTARRPTVSPARPVAPKAPAPADSGPKTPASARAADPETAPKRAPVDVKDRMATIDMTALDKTEEEWMARLLEDPAFAQQLFDAFLAETDPMKMSFLQNIAASSPEIRNDPAWQDKFMAVAENDASSERKMTALLFLQQAERIAPVQERLYGLAEHGGDLRGNALITLKGLPDQRQPDPRLAETAGRIADTERDPYLRGLALRIEENPAHAERFLGDSDKEVRLQAAQVVSDVAALTRTLAVEKDPEAKEVLQMRIEILTREQNPLPGPRR